MNPPTEPWTPPDEYGYSWLLGFYLGDGCVAGARRSHQLRIVLDRRYPGVIDECFTAMTMVLPMARVHVRPRKTDGGVIVEVSSPLLAEIFPQHGPGRKHTRPIVLTEWQRRIVDAHPAPFLWGLLFSDGCRTINRFKTKLPNGRVAEYEYPRYFFSNRSADIRSLFCEYCERLGIRWDAIECAEHLCVAPYERRAARLLRRAEELTRPRGTAATAR